MTNFVYHKFPLGKREIVNFDRVSKIFVFQKEIEKISEEEMDEILEEGGSIPEPAFEIYVTIDGEDILWENIEPRYFNHFSDMFSDMGASDAAEMYAMLLGQSNGRLSPLEFVQMFSTFNHPDFIERYGISKDDVDTVYQEIRESSKSIQEKILDLKISYRWLR